MKTAIPIVLFYCLLLFNPFRSCAQEESVTVMREGTKYVDLRLKSLEKYNARLEKEQQRLLSKLKRKEERLAHKLQHTDSAAYARLQSQKLTYDSISKLSSQPDSAGLAKTAQKKNKVIDSLRGVQSFVQTNAAKLNQSPLGQTGISGNVTTTGANTQELNRLQGELNYRTYINELITQRTNNLNSLGSGSNMPALSGIQKQVYYGKAKMNSFKQIEEDPSKAEDIAYEYLQGSEGFDKAISGATQQGAGMQTLTGNESADMLQKMGYQTKSQVQGDLQKKFGSNLGSVSQNMGQQIGQYQDKMNELKQSKQSLQQLKQTGKTSFKINPMRGMPFWKRIEKQYNTQTARATTTTPALMELSAMAGYKQSKKLTYGVGVATSIGLGQSWSNIHFSFQGLGLRSYISWQWQYGIGLYAGYERMYKLAVFLNTTTATPSPTSTIPTDEPHNTDNYSESVLIGLTKSYHMNDKWNGQIQLLYDIWWQQKGLRSPIVLRFATVKI